ncbi:cysteine desulfurase [Klebsiella pneumoniae]|nr:cysteine desulfurase [Klebsiella pneumoniae]
MTFSVEQVRADFPVLNREVNGQPLVYLDSAASAQKPEAVIGAEAEFYRHGYAAVHRGIHTLSAEATARMEAVRQQAATFLNAGSAEEVVFVRGTTEGINLVANSWGNANVGAGDNIIISEMEHHANIVPWQMLCARVGAELRVIPLNPDGTLQLDVVPGLFDPRTRLLAITEVSNVLGTENPLAALIALAHQHGAESAGGWRPGGDAPPGGRPGAGLRFLCFLRPQAVWADRDRRALRPVRAAADDGALGRGRVDDRHRQPDGGHHLESGAVAL